MWTTAVTLKNSAFSHMIITVISNSFFKQHWPTDLFDGKALCSILNRSKGKAVLVTVHEGPQGCETSRLPHFLDNQLTDGGEVVGSTRRPVFTPRKIPGTHFCWRLSRPQGHSANVNPMTSSGFEPATFGL
jgi:hypothetical protein